MEIIKADDIGFCTGVKRAIDIIEKAGHELGSMQTLGPVVHNQQVVDKLAASGVVAIDSLDQASGHTIAVSSHGVSPQLLQEARSRGLRIIDTTCPFVRRAQLAAQKLAGEGYSVIVFGETSHPEVQGVLGYAGNNGLATVEIPEFAGIPKQVGLLSQTTQSFPGFLKFVSTFIDRYLETIPEIRVINTICNATRRHQQSAIELSKQVDLMLVVGSHHSANTRRLAEICSTLVPTYHIETADEIDASWWQSLSSQRIGITAGASTPDDTIAEVISCLKKVAI